MEEKEITEIETKTKVYIIKQLIQQCKSMAEFKNYYDYIINLMTEEKIYSLSTIIK